MSLKKKKKKGKIKKILFNSIPIIIIVGALFFYFYPPSFWLANHLKSTPIKRFPVTKHQTKDEKKETNAPNYGNESQLEPTTENLWKASQADYIASGGVFIPSAEIRLPIYHGIGYYTMLKGAGEQYPEDIVKVGEAGNYVIASHLTPYQGYLFTDLDKVQQGQDVYLVGSNTNLIYRYQIDWKETFDPQHSQSIQQEEAKETVEQINETKIVDLKSLGVSSVKVGDTISKTTKDFQPETGSEIETSTSLTVKSVDSDKITILEEGTKKTKQCICTIYTCTDTYSTHRLVVRGHLVEEIPAEKASAELKEAYSGWFSGTF